MGLLSPSTSLTVWSSREVFSRHELPDVLCQVSANCQEIERELAIETGAEQRDQLAGELGARGWQAEASREEDEDTNRSTQ